MPIQPQISPARNAAGKGAGAGGAIALILAALFAVEGGYSNNPHDPGGETNHGVTKAVAVANGYTGPMRSLTKDRAAEIATKQYIDAPGFHPIVDIDPAVGGELVDTGFNVGPAREALWFQQSLNHLNNRGADYADLPEDGKIGPGTIAAFKLFRQRRGAAGCRVMVRMLDAKQAQHYMKLFGKNSGFETFAFGWFNTRIGNIDLARCGSK